MFCLSMYAALDALLKLVVVSVRPKPATLSVSRSAALDCGIVAVRKLLAAEVRWRTAMSALDTRPQ